MTNHQFGGSDITRGDIFYADLSPVVGSEQGGLRPVLILQNDVGNRYSPTVIAAAITSRTGKNRLPTHIDVTTSDVTSSDGSSSEGSANGSAYGTAGSQGYGGLAKSSVVLLEQIRTLDKRRLREKLGHLSPEAMRSVEKAVRISFGLGDGEQPAPTF